MPRRSEEYRARRREQILEAAVSCFARQGLHHTTMADIIAEAGTSAGAVYCYFAGKDEIIAAIAEERHREEAARLGRLAQSDDLLRRAPPVRPRVLFLAERARRETASSSEHRGVGRGPLQPTPRRHRAGGRRSACTPQSVDRRRAGPRGMVARRSIPRPRPVCYSPSCRGSSSSKPGSLRSTASASLPGSRCSSQRWRHTAQHPVSRTSDHDSPAETGCCMGQVWMAPERLGLAPTSALV